MLQIRLNCENCDTELQNDSDKAMICSFECTFCEGCVTEVLMNVCPNCGGGFEKRPTRPTEQLKKHPARKNKIFNPVIDNSYLKKYCNIHPRKR